MRLESTVKYRENQPTSKGSNALQAYCDMYIFCVRQLVSSTGHCVLYVFKSTTMGPRPYEHACIDGRAYSVKTDGALVGVPVPDAETILMIIQRREASKIAESQ